MLDPFSWNFLDSDLDGLLFFFNCFVWLRGKFCSYVNNAVEMYYITDIKMTFFFNFRMDDTKWSGHGRMALDLCDELEPIWIYGSVFHGYFTKLFFR